MPTARELRTIAKEMNIRGYSKMNKESLTNAIESNVVPDEKPVETDKLLDRDELPVEPKSARKSTSKWVKFCKEHSKEKGISYKAAMSCKEEYALWKDKIEKREFDKKPKEEERLETVQEE